MASRKTAGAVRHSAKKQRSDARTTTKPAKPVVADDRDMPQEVTTEIIGTITMRSGPIPDPVELEQYERTVQGAADRIITMAEEAQKTRSRMGEFSYRINMRKINGGILVVLALIAATVAALYFNQTQTGGIAALILAIGGVSGVVRQFLRSVFAPKDKENKTRGKN